MERAGQKWPDSGNRDSGAAGPRRRASGNTAVDPAAPHPHLHVILFSPSALVERSIESPGELPPADDYAVRWVNIEGLGDSNTVRELGGAFGLQPLALDDIVDVQQRPKFEAYDDHPFIFLSIPRGDMAHR